MASDQVVLLYYKYVEISDVEAVLEEQRDKTCTLDLNGRIRVASEGINGTLSGSKSLMRQYIEFMNGHSLFGDIDWKRSEAPTGAVLPFDDLVVRKVNHLVGCPNITKLVGSYSVDKTGIHLAPDKFHDKLQASEPTVVIDVRNKYEYAIGHFKNAVNPDTRTFDEFSCWVDRAAADGLFADKQVLMYCTGGIRCEKASMYLKQVANSDDVYQLQGGIHKYLEEYSSGGEFMGKNFVFDNRVVQPVTNSSVIGQCLYCACAWDTVSDDVRCSKCRIKVLACPTCVDDREGSVYCDTHQYLAIRSRDDCTRLLAAMEELLQQEKALLAECNRCKEAARRKALKRQRRAKAVQIADIEQALSFERAQVRRVNA